MKCCEKLWQDVKKENREEEVERQVENTLTFRQLYNILEQLYTIPDSFIFILKYI